MPRPHWGKMELVVLPGRVVPALIDPGRGEIGERPKPTLPQKPLHQADMRLDSVKRPYAVNADEAPPPKDGDRAHTQRAAAARYSAAGSWFMYTGLGSVYTTSALEMVFMLGKLRLLEVVRDQTARSAVARSRTVPGEARPARPTRRVGVQCTSRHLRRPDARRLAEVRSLPARTS